MSTATNEPAAATAGERGDFTPIGDYGLLADCNSAALVARDAKTFGGPNRIEVASAVPLMLRDAGLHARFAVREGRRLGFALVWAPPERRDAPQPTAPEDVAARV